MTKTSPLKTREQVLADFKEAGITYSEWARANGFHRMTVVDLLRGTRQGLRGESHRCAVALGLKAGVVVDVSKFKPAVKSVSHKVKTASTPASRKSNANKAGPAK